METETQALVSLTPPPYPQARDNSYEMDSDDEEGDYELLHVPVFAKRFQGERELGSPSGRTKGIAEGGSEGKGKTQTIDQVQLNQDQRVDVSSARDDMVLVTPTPASAGAGTPPAARTTGAPVPAAGSEKNADCESAQKEAHRIVTELRYLMIDKIKRMDDLRWWVLCNKPSRYGEAYPCRIVRDPNEYRFLDIPDGTDTVIQYIGHYHNYVAKFDLVSENNLVPMVHVLESGGDDDRVNNDKSGGSNNGYRLPQLSEFIALFSNSIKKHEGLDNSPQNLLVEQFVIKESVKHVHEKLLQAKADDDRINRLLLPTSSSAKDCHLNSSDALAWHPSSGDSDDDDALFDPERRKSRRNLRVGDIIEYYQEVGVFGDKQHRRRCEILGIDTAEDLPLNTRPYSCISRGNKVMRVMFLKKGGHLVKISNPGFMELERYSMETSGNLDFSAGLRSDGQAIANIWKDVNLMKFGGDQENAETKPAAKDPGSTNAANLNSVNNVSLRDPPKTAGATKTATSSRKRPPVSSSSNKTPVRASPLDADAPPTKKKSRTNESVARSAVASSEQSACDEAAAESGVRSEVAQLDKLIGIVKSNMSKYEGRRRNSYRPHMTVAQLTQAKDVWGRIGRVGQKEEAVADMAERCDLTQLELRRYLAGDKEKKMGGKQIKEIEEALSEMMSGDCDDGEGNRTESSV